MPGMTVAALRSIMRAPAGMSTDDPTLTIRSPLMRMIWLFRMAPDLDCNIRPALVAASWSRGARYLAGGGLGGGAVGGDCEGRAAAAIVAAMETTARVLCQRMKILPCDSLQA